MKLQTSILAILLSAVSAISASAAEPADTLSRRLIICVTPIRFMILKS